MYLIFREQIDKINSIKVPYKEDTPVGNNYPEIRELLQQKADYQARLNLLPYDGSPEIKEQGGKQYLYIRKRIASRLTSEYVDVYSDTLYQTLLRNAREARELKKQIRRIEKQLAQQGYTESELSDRVILNIDFAHANMKANIYDQAVLEGVMMKNKDDYAVAIRKPNGEIEVEVDVYWGILHDSALKKIPFIRGIFNFLDSMILGMKTINYSASFYEDEEAEETKLDKALNKVSGGRAEKILMAVTTVASIVIAIAEFLLLH